MRIVEREGKLIIVDYNELELYTIACKIKKEGISFFKKLVESTDNIEQKEILEILLDAEKRHLEVFKERFNFFKKRSVINKEDEELLTTLDYGVFPPVYTLNRFQAFVLDSEKLLKLATLFKKSSIQFYEQCKDKINSFLGEIELDYIINAEEKQKQFLTELLSSIQFKKDLTPESEKGILSSTDTITPGVVYDM